MIDLLVTNYNTSDKLIRLIDVLHSDAKRYCQPWNLYIADNGSTDDSIEKLVAAADRYFIKHIDKNDNVGYARSSNKLASYGEADIIGILNADVWLTTDDILDIQKAFDQNSEISILGPKQRDEQGHITHGGIFGTLEAPKHRAWKFHDTNDSTFRELEQCITVSGSAYFIRRIVWDVLTMCPIYRSYCHEYLEADPAGAFLPVSHYYEETACSYHAASHGFKAFYDGRVSIGHSWHASHPIGSPQDQMFQVSQGIFRNFCDIHNILHD